MRGRGFPFPTTRKAATMSETRYTIHVGAEMMLCNSPRLDGYLSDWETNTYSPEYQNAAQFSLEEIGIVISNLPASLPNMVVEDIIVEPWNQAHADWLTLKSVELIDE
jgi:hypothetical protein